MGDKIHGLGVPWLCPIPGTFQGIFQLPRRRIGWLVRNDRVPDVTIMVETREPSSQHLMPSMVRQPAVYPEETWTA